MFVLGFCYKPTRHETAQDAYDNDVVAAKACGARAATHGSMSQDRKKRSNASWFVRQRSIPNDEA